MMYLALQAYVLYQTYDYEDSESEVQDKTVIRSRLLQLHGSRLSERTLYWAHGPVYHSALHLSILILTAVTQHRCSIAIIYAHKQYTYIKYTYVVINM